MPHFSLKKQLFIYFLATFLTSLAVTGLWAHSGEKHEAKAQISLPDVVAKVNGSDIKGDTIMRELKKTISKYKSKGTPLTIDQEKTTAKKLIEDEIGRTVLIQKGKEIGVNVSAQMLDKKLNAIKSNFKSDAVFEHKLADEGLTLQQYQNELKKDLIMDEVIKKEIESKIKIPEKEIQSYFEKNIDKYKSPDKVRASVILLKLNSKAGAGMEQKKKKKLESILVQIKNGAEFASMAQRFSEDSLKSKGGDLGFFTKNQMFKPFSERAFKLKIGEVSEIFKTSHGLHILKVTDKKPGVTKSFEEVKKNIESILKNRKVGKATRDYILALKKQADVKTYF